VGSTVQAVVGSRPCGRALVGSGGSVQFTVAAEPPPPGNRALAVGGRAFLRPGVVAPSGSVVVALVNGAPCGQGTVGSGGSFQLSVAAATQVPGCGTNGATVTYTLGGRPAVPSSLFQSGGSIVVQIFALGP